MMTQTGLDKTTQLIFICRATVVHEVFGSPVVEHIIYIPIDVYIQQGFDAGFNIHLIDVLTFSAIDTIFRRQNLTSQDVRS